MNKTAAHLRMLLPLLGAVREGGAFNNAVQASAGNWANGLREAAGEDAIVADDLARELEGLAAATEFEPQQAALDATIASADALLGQILDGTAPRLNAPLMPLKTLLEQIASGAESMIDVFRPDPRLAGSIRTGASQVTALVDADIRAGLRPESDKDVAVRLFDSADRLGDGSHAQREAAASAVARCARELVGA